MAGRRQYFVYILASKKRGTLYIGVTNNLARRMYEHKSGAVPGFSDRYGLKILVWYELHEEVEVAIQREKSLKRWYRDWKIELIEQDNPDWRDLADELGP